MNITQIQDKVTETTTQAAKVWNEYVTPDRVALARKWAAITAKVTLCTLALATLLTLILVGYLVYGLAVVVRVAYYAYMNTKNLDLVTVPLSETYEKATARAVSEVVYTAKLAYLGTNAHKVKQVLLSTFTTLWSKLIELLDREAGVVTDPLTYVETTVEVDESQAQDPEELE